MQFDPALAAREALRTSGKELGADWGRALELEEIFSSNTGPIARQAFEQLLDLAGRHPAARSFLAFCIYITWQQVMEETIPRHFHAGIDLCETYLSLHGREKDGAGDRITELLRSFRAGVGLEEEDEFEIELRRDTPKGGD
jgi:hypothetical protein